MQALHPGLDRYRCGAGAAGRAFCLQVPALKLGSRQRCTGCAALAPHFTFQTLSSSEEIFLHLVVLLATS